MKQNIVKSVWDLDNQYTGVWLCYAHFSQTESFRGSENETKGK